MSRDISGLARGTEVRSRRADLKRRIRDRDVDVPALLDGGGDQADERTALDMAVYSLVLSMPGIGDETIRELAGNGHAFSLHASTRLAHLTIRQRQALAAALRKENRL